MRLERRPVGEILSSFLLNLIRGLLTLLKTLALAMFLRLATSCLRLPIIAPYTKEKLSPCIDTLEPSVAVYFIEYTPAASADVSSS